jgi:formate dehydrogenase subunit delta
MAQVDKLVMMANQIALFFKSYPREEAIAGIASHIEAFWTPKMRESLTAERMNLPKLDPLVVEAMSPEVDAQSPAEKAAATPGKVGELGAVDAG